jgi:anti-sigma factor RsiW
MPCENWRQQLDRYADGEMESSEGTALLAHLRTCLACTSEVLERVQLKRAVQEAGRRYAPSAEFRHRIARAVEGKAKRGFARRWQFILIPALAVLVAAFFLNSYIDRERAAKQGVYSELADLHVATLASASPVDVVSSDRHTVKPWFQGRIPFTFNLPELSGTNFSLLGGRVFYLAQTPGAHLIYQLRKHELSVFIVPENSAEMKNVGDGSSKASSFNMESWEQNGLRYFIVGDTSADDIRSLEKLLRDAG